MPQEFYEMRNVCLRPQMGHTNERCFQKQMTAQKDNPHGKRITDKGSSNQHVENKRLAAP